MGIFSRRKSDEAQQETPAVETSVEATESVVGDIRPTALPKNEQLREGSGLHMLAELMRSKGKGQTTLELKQTGNDMNLAFFKDGVESESVVVVPGNEWFNGVAKLYTEEEKSERGAWTRALIVLDSGESENYSVQASYMNSETRQTHNLNYGTSAASLEATDSAVSAESVEQEEKEETASSSAPSSSLTTGAVAGGAVVGGAVATGAAVAGESATEAEEADPVSRLSSISERLSGSSESKQASEAVNAEEAEVSESFSAVAFGKDEVAQESANLESADVSAEADEPAQTSATPLYDSLVAEGRISEAESATTTTASSFFAKEAPVSESTEAVNEVAESSIFEDAASENSASENSASENTVSDSTVSEASETVAETSVAESAVTETSAQALVSDDYRAEDTVSELSSDTSAELSATETVEETPDYVTVDDLPTAEQAIAARKQREQEQAEAAELAAVSVAEEETEAVEAESTKVESLKTESDYVTSTYDFAGDDSLVEVDETAQAPEVEEAEVSSLAAGSAVVGGTAVAGTAAAAAFAAQDRAEETDATETAETVVAETEATTEDLVTSEEPTLDEGETETYVQEIPEHIEDEWDEEPLTSSSLTGINAQVPANAVGYDVAPSYNMPTQPVYKPSKTRKAEGNLVLSEAEVVARLSGAQEALFGANGTARDVSTVLIRVRTLGSYYDALTHVREAGLWAQKKTFDLIPEDVLNILQIKADSYKEGVGSPLAMSIRFTPGIPPVAAFDYANEEAFVKYNDHLPAQQYVEELRMFPRTGANIPEHMNQALTSWSF